MKKLLSIILALVLVFSFSLAAFAAYQTDSLTGAGTKNQTLYMRVDVASNTYKVDIAWKSLEFKYTYGSWNTTNHDYTGGQWNTDTTNGQSAVTNGIKSPVTVTNHSNAAVKYSLSTSASSSNGVTIAVSPTSATTISAVSEGGSATSNSSAAYVQVTGTPTNVQARAKISTITVSLTT